MEYLKDFDVTINKTISPVMKPTFVKAIVHLLLVLYAARIAPQLPRVVYKLFENQYFKLFIFSLILWTAQFSPSISILISLAFIMTINYANQQPIWEFMENVGDKNAIDAVKQLAEAAASPTASPAETIIPLANTVASVVKTETGVTAVKALAEQAMTASPGVPEKIVSAVETVIESTAMPAPAPVPVPAPTPAQAVEGIKILAQAAASPTPASPETVVPIANAVASVATTTSGINAIKALVEQAMTPEAGVPEKVEEAVQVAVTSVVPEPAPAPAPAPTATPVQSKEPELQPAPCYPIRRQDMSKVGSYEVGNYQDWKA